MRRPIVVLFLTALAGTGSADYIGRFGARAQLFETLSCVQCHSVNGKGGTIGPDLGRIVDRGFTPARSPRPCGITRPAMWAAMRQTRHLEPAI